MLLRFSQPALRRAALLAGGTSALLGATRLTHANAAPSDASLGSLWATALDGMIGVPASAELSSPDGVLFLAPASVDSPPTPKAVWPRLFAKGVVFSLTASNPMGKDSPAAWNVEANKHLEEDIREMTKPSAPRAWWRSFGFNAAEGWRENGFSVAFANEERAFAKVAVLRLAHKYSQAAVYYYHVEDGVIVREVLWVDPSKQGSHGSKEPMRVLTAPFPSTPLAAKDWRQPEDAALTAPGVPPQGQVESFYNPGPRRKP